MVGKNDGQEVLVRCCEERTQLLVNLMSKLSKKSVPHQNAVSE
jgi:hypothetical protein